jgi:hypothetical protein
MSNIKLSRRLQKTIEASQSGLPTSSIGAIDQHRTEMEIKARIDAGRTEDAIRSTPIWALRQKIKENRKANEKSRVIQSGNITRFGISLR